MNRNIRRPLRKGITTGCVIFVLILCFGLGVINYSSYRKTLYNHYEDYVSNLLLYTSGRIDVDDLEECIRTGNESEKFKELQFFLDGVKDGVRLDWIYIIVPLNTDPVDNVKNVIAGNSKYEYEVNGGQSTVRLNMLTGDSYSPEIAEKYIKAYNRENISFFEDDTEWGNEYTGLLPLRDSRGNNVAALCIDVNVDEIYSKLNDQVMSSILFTAFLGTVFTVLFISWIEVNVSYPITHLEEAVSKFAGISHLQVSPDELVLDVPEIHTHNEVEALSNEIGKMGEDFRNYALNLEAAEKEAEEKSLALREALAVAEGASKAKTAFLSNMSHEIRTPMNAIIGLDNIALNDPDLSETTRDHLEKINSSARHLLNIINDILDMSRIESGKMAVKNEPFCFRESIEQVNTIISGQCSDKGLNYTYTTEGKIDEYYVGDAMKLKQALINIMGNAVKFTPEGGNVSLDIKEGLRFDGMATLHFTISDTGIGMSRKYVNHIFDAFSQEDDSHTSRYGSTGLGMAITKSIVEMMNGNIEVKSRKGKGSTFRVTVTLGEAVEPSGIDAPAGEAPQSMVDLKGRHILLAEDVEINAEIMVMVLGMREVEVDVAANGHIAVDMYNDHEEGYYDAILMDMRMPEMDGLEATKKIREAGRADSASIPIIALTANAFEEDVQRSMQSGLNAHLSKPVEAAQLYAALERCILPEGQDSNE